MLAHLTTRVDPAAKWLAGGRIDYHFEDRRLELEYAGGEAYLFTDIGYDEYLSAIQRLAQGRGIQLVNSFGKYIGEQIANPAGVPVRPDSVPSSIESARRCAQAYRQTLQFGTAGAKAWARTALFA